MESTSVSSFVPGLLVLHSFHSAILDSNDQFLFFSFPFFSFLFFIVVAFRFFAFFSLSSSTVWTESKQKRDFFTYLRTKKFLGVKHLTEWSLAPYSSHCDQFWFIVSSDTDYFDYSTSWKSEYHTSNVVEISFQIERLFSLCLVLNPFETSCSVYLFLSSNLNSSWFQDHEIQYFSRKKRSPFVFFLLLSFLIFFFLLFSSIFILSSGYLLLHTLPPRRIRGERIVYAASWLLTWYDFFRFCLVRQFVTGGGDYLPGT